MMPRHYPIPRPLSTCQAILTLSLILVAVASFGLSGAAPADEKAGPTVKLKGQVRDADGNPAAGAAVWAMSTDSGPPRQVEATTDAKGNYALDLPPAKWYVWASHGTQGGETAESVPIQLGQTPSETPIRLEVRGTFRGRLLEAETGKPIPGGRLHLDVGKTLTADAAGRFSMGGLSRTHHEAFVLAPGRSRMRVLFDTTGKVDTELDIPVPRAGKIVGRVTDLDGKPIAGAFVGRSTSGTTFSIRALMSACDKDGRFEYDGTATEGQVTLEAYAPGFAGDEQKGRVPPGGKPATLDFRLRPKPGKDKSPDAEKLREVSGVVSLPDGKPAVGVLVRWGYYPYSGAIATRTDEKGRFRFDVPDKPNMVAVLPSTFQPEFPQVAEGGKKEVAVKLREGKTARGTVRDEAGKPLANVRVVAQMPSPDPRLGNPFWLTEAATTTDQLGRFEVRGVPRLAWFDFLRRDLSDERRVSLDFDADNTLKMKYGGAISGRVVDRDGKPIRSFRVTLDFPRVRKPDDRTQGYFAGYSGIGVRFTSDDGTFVLTGVGADCVYRVKVLADGHGEAIGERVISLPINRVANATPTTLRAGPPVKFRVRTVTPDGKPIAGARVTLIDGQERYDKEYTWDSGGWEDSGTAKTAADGWADFPSLTFSAATLIVRAPGHGRYRIGWRKKEKEIVAVLQKEAVFSGEVLDAKGAPVRNCYVVMTRDGDRLAATIEPDSKGRFRVEELPPGEWLVVVTGEDGLTSLHRENVTLKAGESKVVKVQLKK